MNDNYNQAMRQTLELHFLMAAGMDDSPEAEAIRDASDQVWKLLSEEERTKIGDFSEYLYSMQETQWTTTSK